MQEKENLEIPRNQEEFDKFLSKKCENSFERYTYMRLFNDNEVYAKIFNREFNSELLLLIHKTFKEQVIDNPAFNNRTEQMFVTTILWRIAKTPDFDFTLSFLEPEELAVIKTMVEDELD